MERQEPFRLKNILKTGEEYVTYSVDPPKIYIDHSWNPAGTCPFGSAAGVVLSGSLPCPWGKEWKRIEDTTGRGSRKLAVPCSGCSCLLEGRGEKACVHPIWDIPG